MYEIWADNELIYSDVTPLETTKVVNPKLTLADSAAGQLDMSLPPVNVGYSTIKRMVTDITVKEDGQWLWSGRVLQDSYDFWNNRKMVCEGEIAFLNDSIQPPAKYDVSNDHTTIRSFFESLINIHNGQVEENRRFVVGNVTVSDGDMQDDNDEINRFTNYETTLQCINDKLLSRLGGHLRVRHEIQNGSEVRVLDYIDDSQLGTNSQIVRFGVNLLDFSKNIDMSQLSTVIVPRGQRLEEESAVEVEGLEPYLTVKSLGDKYETNPETGASELWHQNGSLFVMNPTAVGNFGWIAAVVDWDAVTDVNNLYNKAVKYLKDEQYEKMTLEIKALDLKYLTYDVSSIKFQTNLRCISEPHNMDHVFLVSKMEIDLSNPGNSLYTLGSDVQLSLTQATSRVNSEVQAEIAKMPSKSEILRAAQRNAYYMITGAENSYVHFIPGQRDGVPYGIQRIEVTDGPTYIAENDDDSDPTTDPFPDSYNRWIWTVGGLGHIGRNNLNTQWESIASMNVALQMDGAIVADRITTGSLSCSRLNGGEINGQTIRGGSIIGSTIDTTTGGSITAHAGNIAVLGGGYMQYHEIDTGTSNQWVFDLGCRHCNCEYKEGGSWHWVNGGATEIYKYLEGAYNPSDQRSKTNIEDLDFEFSKKLIMGTKPKMFEFNFKEGIKQFGMIAQDQEELLKDIGFNKKNGLLSIPDNPDEWMSIEYKQFVPHLINMVQHQQKEIEELRQNRG